MFQNILALLQIKTTSPAALSLIDSVMMFKCVYANLSVIMPMFFKGS